MAHFYILYSSQLDKYYIGHTDGDLADRIRRHLTDHKGFTAKAKDWQLVCKESFPDKSAAYKREREVKGLKSRKMIETLIKKGLEHPD